MQEEKTIEKLDPIQTLEKVTNAVLQEPIEVTVEITPVNKMHAWLQKIKWLQKFFPAKKIFNIYPINMGSLVKISNLLLSIDKELFDKENLLHSNYNVIVKHSKTLCTIIAIAIHNKKTKHPERLVSLIMEQFNPKDIANVMMAVFKQMNVPVFMSSIISIAGLNILEMNPQTQGSSIAPGMSSEELLNTSAGPKTTYSGN